MKKMMWGLDPAAAEAVGAPLATRPAEAIAAARVAKDARILSSFNYPRDFAASLRRASDLDDPRPAYFCELGRMSDAQRFSQKAAKR